MMKTLTDHQPLFQRTGLALVALLGAASSLHALASALPMEHAVGRLSYVSGGVAQEEAKTFKAAFNQFPLVVELYEQAGTGSEYTADARVKISDEHGQLLMDEHADGPFMLVRLPAGRYRVAASLGGHSLPERTVQVTDHGHLRTRFEFPAHAG